MAGDGAAEIDLYDNIDEDFVQECADLNELYDDVMAPGAQNNMASKPELPVAVTSELCSFCVMVFGSDQSARTAMEKLPKTEIHGQNPVVTHCTKHNLSIFEKAAGGDGQPTTRPRSDESYSGKLTGLSSSSSGTTSTKLPPPLMSTPTMPASLGFSLRSNTSLMGQAAPSLRQVANALPNAFQALAQTVQSGLPGGGHLGQLTLNLPTATSVLMTPSVPPPPLPGNASSLFPAAFSLASAIPNNLTSGAAHINPNFLHQPASLPSGTLPSPVPAPAALMQLGNASAQQSVRPQFDNYGRPVIHTYTPYRTVTLLKSRRNIPTGPEHNPMRRASRRQVKVSLRSDREVWWTQKAKEMEEAQKAASAQLICSTGPRKPPVSESIKHQIGTTISNKEERLYRWAEYFEQQLSWPPTDTHLEPTGEVEPWTVNVEPPTASEVYDCICSLKRHRAPGPDDLPPTLFEVGGEVFSQRLSDLFACIREKESVPDNWGESVIVPVFKKRGAYGKLSESEFEDILQRNKTVSSSAINRAVQDAASGDYASAIETLVTAISLIKQSKIANDDRCRILINSLQDTLHGIESKSYGTKSSSRRRRRSYSDSGSEGGVDDYGGSSRRHRERGNRSRSRDRSDRHDRHRRSRDRTSGTGNSYYGAQSGASHAGGSGLSSGVSISSLGSGQGNLGSASSGGSDRYRDSRYRH
ncbi:hypothetical protein T265_10894 [Opisthorchis viverrini]|uniref:CPSF6/7 RSLD domain-containing protein n=1 Tax=Opisthorchis viverrini TaxID=6198 RepID=A0A074ZBJ5_OPIVI|nr:hypothetical protein T265_10894 [Opisthorchis viverrini]KER20595.1 hypothetical protein T265_10894 [Opisthorchis viverrini]